MDGDSKINDNDKEEKSFTSSVANEEQFSISIINLVSPLMKYKIQIIIFMIIGLFSSVFIHFLWGGYVYVSQLQYQFATEDFPKEIDDYVKSKRFMDYANKISKNISGKFSYFKDEFKKPDKNRVKNSILFTIKASDKKSIETIAKDFDVKLTDHLNQESVNSYQLFINGLNKQKIIVKNSLISFINGLQTIKFKQADGIKIFYDDRKKQYLLVDERTVPIKILEYNAGESDVNYSHLIDKHNFEQKKTINQELIELIISLSKANMGLFPLIIKQKKEVFLSKIIPDHQKLNKTVASPGKPGSGKISREVNSDILDLAEEIGKLKAKKNHLLAEINNKYKRLLIYSFFTDGYYTNELQSLVHHNKSKIENRPELFNLLELKGSEGKTSDEVIVSLTSLESIDKELIQFSFYQFLCRENLIMPLKKNEDVSLQKIHKKYSISDPASKKKYTLSDVPLKIIFLFSFIGLSTGILIAYLRNLFSQT